MELDALNPFIPLNEDDSGLPVAILCFFSTGSGWGSLGQRYADTGATYSVDLRYGRLALRELELALPKGAEARTVTVSGTRGILAARASIASARLSVRFEEEVSLEAGDTLTVTVK